MSKPATSRADFGMTLQVRDHCLCLHAQRAARAVARRFDDAMKPLGLRSGQFSLLISLNRPKPPTIGAVAELLAMDRTTLTANLKPLDRRGLVSVRPDASDRRLRRLVLSAAGRALLDRAAPVWTATHAAIEAELRADPEALRRDLDALRDAAKGVSPAADPSPSPR